jgi:hypothetical protein
VLMKGERRRFGKTARGSLISCATLNWHAAI